MRLSVSGLRKIIAEELVRALHEGKKLPMDKKSQEAHYDSMPELSAIADDSDVLLDDEEVTEAEDSYVVPPETQKKIRHYFKAMGLAGHLPKHARFK